MLSGEFRFEGASKIERSSVFNESKEEGSFNVSGRNGGNTGRVGQKYDKDDEIGCPAPHCTGSPRASEN